ncbi:hypothetical protein [Sphingomonas crocodyli]|uniref:Uncharacterized protein n=1 Tax=Sphingomonas crocodyli TaxID=1979270 RepID=A0A437LYG5_9SPHN|nr:hypothetical protein [Sphingomonas crocodyli]RVT90427.1 hypothetical protein EOD43_19405 [Sphingomonas crocodyli]
MPHYQLYRFSGLSIIDESDIEADSDQEAMALACLGLRGRTCDLEIWLGRRLVATLPRGRPPILDGPRRWCDNASMAKPA